MPPPVPDGSVVRRALLERLAASPATLVSVSAPAGYGKTTFLAQAAGHERRAVAWVSLDAHDDDPATLVGLLAAALHLVRPIETTVFEAIAAPAISPWSAVTRLSSALEDHPAVVLFVDDADALAPGQPSDVLAVLPDLLPRGSRLVVASRASPPIELSRRRAAGTAARARPDRISPSTIGRRSNSPGPWIMGSTRRPRPRSTGTPRAGPPGCTSGSWRSADASDGDPEPRPGRRRRHRRRLPPVRDPRDRSVPMLSRSCVGRLSWSG